MIIIDTYKMNIIKTISHGKEYYFCDNKYFNTYDQAYNYKINNTDNNKLRKEMIQLKNQNNEFKNHIYELQDCMKKLMYSVKEKQIHINNLELLLQDMTNELIKYKKVNV